MFSHCKPATIHPFSVTVLLLVCLWLLATPCQAAPPAWQGVWSGTLGKARITACLSQDGPSSYRYQRYQKDIPLVLKGNQWQETTNGKVTSIWTLGSPLGDALEGEWQSHQSGHTLPIRLSRLADGGGVSCEAYAYKRVVEDTSAANMQGAVVNVNAGGTKRSEYAYVVNLTDATISTYSINADTGALTQVAGSQPIAGISITTNPAGNFAYVMTYKETKTALSIFRINPNTGKLTKIEGNSVLLEKYPISVTVNPAGTFAYVAMGTIEGAIGMTNISVYRINGVTGALTPVAGSMLALKDEISSFTINPTGTFAYVVDSYVAHGNNISVYRINGATGTLTPVAGSPFESSAVPIFFDNLKINPLGVFAYTVIGGDSSVSAYRINAKTGAFTLVKGSPFKAGKSPNGVTVNPAGTFMYIANMGDHSISAYRINTTTGVLTPIAGSPFDVLGQPQSITIGPAGNFLYTANSNDNSVSAYRINAATGTLTEVEGSPFAMSGGADFITVVQP